MSRSDHRCRAGAPARTAIAGLVAVRTVACGGRSPEDRVSKAIGYAVEDCRENGLTNSGGELSEVAWECRVVDGPKRYVIAFEINHRIDEFNFYSDRAG